jgi:hypothetical protein
MATAARTNSTPTHLDPVDATHLHAVEAGLCLIGADALRRFNLPCPSDAEILACSGYGPLMLQDAHTVETHSLHLRERVAEYLVEGAFVVGKRHQRALARRR